jgi:hypothetical protein
MIDQSVEIRVDVADFFIVGHGGLIARRHDLAHEHFVVHVRVGLTITIAVIVAVAVITGASVRIAGFITDIALLTLATRASCAGRLFLSGRSHGPENEYRRERRDAPKPGQIPVAESGARMTERTTILAWRTEAAAPAFRVARLRPACL